MRPVETWEQGVGSRLARGVRWSLEMGVSEIPRSLRFVGVDGLVSNPILSSSLPEPCLTPLQFAVRPGHRANASPSGSERPGWLDGAVPVPRARREGRRGAEHGEERQRWHRETRALAGEWPLPRLEAERGLLDV